MADGGRVHKRSWSELKRRLKDVRLNSAAAAVPSRSVTDVKFRRLDDFNVENCGARGHGVRIYFISSLLVSGKGSGGNTIMSADVIFGDRESACDRIQWAPLLDSSFLQSVVVHQSAAATRSSSKCSKPDVATLFDRKRIVSCWGVSSYELHPSGSRILFTSGERLFYCSTGGETQRVPVYPTEVSLCGGGYRGRHSPVNAEFCPTNPDLIAYVFDGDIWVHHLSCRNDDVDDHCSFPRRVTSCTISSARRSGSKSGRRRKPRDRSAGYPSFVMQEEFDRYQGYWWQPVTRDGVYRILFEEVDETHVETYSFGSAMMSSAARPSGNEEGEDGDDESSSEEYKFPRAGTANARSLLKMVEFRLSETDSHPDRSATAKIRDVRVLTLEEGTMGEEYIRDSEYVVRAGWIPEGDFVWARLLDRPQQCMRTVLVPSSAFCCADDDACGEDETDGDADDGDRRMDNESSSAPPPATSCRVSSSVSSSSRHPPATVLSRGGSHASSCRDTGGVVELLVQTAPHWLNVDDVLYWFPRDAKTSSDFRFIYASEESGFRHLYFAAVRGDCADGEDDDEIMTSASSSSSSSATAAATTCRKRKVTDERRAPPRPRSCCTCRPPPPPPPPVPLVLGEDGDGVLGAGDDDDEEVDEDSDVALDHDDGGAGGWRSGGVTIGGGRRITAAALTWGQWEITGNGIWVDLVNGIVFFTGFRDTPLEKHLYAVALDEPGRVRRLTTPGYSHSVSVSVPDPLPSSSGLSRSKLTVVVDVFSSVSAPPMCQVCRVVDVGASCTSPSPSLSSAVNDCVSRPGVTMGKVDRLLLLRIGYVSGPDAASAAVVTRHIVPDLGYEPPEIFSHRIRSGDVLYGMIFKPPNMIPGAKYPTLLAVYGGPKAQLVTNSFKSSKQSRNHIFAAMGYCVVCIDGRGSEHRGHEFEAHLYRRMGTVEMKDQVEVLRWLAGCKPYIDVDRIAVHGWSYGGYLSLAAIIRYPEVFKIAIAAAPVTCWHLYDTAYTERYMELPSANRTGYDEGSILSQAHQLPDEENRLLIIHGLMDDNVHFAHTTRLIDALVKAGKPYQLLVYPGERHSLRHYRSNEHYEVSVLSFLELHL